MKSSQNTRIKSSNTIKSRKKFSFLRQAHQEYNTSKKLSLHHSIQARIRQAHKTQHHSQGQEEDVKRRQLEPLKNKRTPKRQLRKVQNLAPNFVLLPHNCTITLTFKKTPGSPGNLYPSPSPSPASTNHHTHALMTHLCRRFEE